MTCHAGGGHQARGGTGLERTPSWWECWAGGGAGPVGASEGTARLGGGARLEGALGWWGAGVEELWAGGGTWLEGMLGWWVPRVVGVHWAGGPLGWWGRLTGGDARLVRPWHEAGVVIRVCSSDLESRHTAASPVVSGKREEKACILLARAVCIWLHVTPRRWAGARPCQCESRNKGQ